MCYLRQKYSRSRGMYQKLEKTRELSRFLLSWSLLGNSPALRRCKGIHRCLSRRPDEILIFINNELLESICAIAMLFYCDVLFYICFQT